MADPWWLYGVAGLLGAFFLGCVTGFISARLTQEIPR